MDNSKRDLSIDALKGLAILLVAMVFLGAYFRDGNLAIRLLFTVEMPCFYVAAGFTMGLSANRQSQKQVAWRTFWLFFYAVLLDALFWQKIPLLYGEPFATIAICTPFIYLLCRSKNSRWLIIAFVISVLFTPILQNQFGYRDVQTNQMYWWQYVATPFAAQMKNVNTEAILRSWFVDGWSPIFPYFAFFCFGAFLQRSGWRDLADQKWRILVWSIVVLVVSGLLWKFFPGQNMRRMGYLEMSYPPVPAYVLFNCSFVFFFVVLMDLTHQKIKNFLQFFGRAPLASFLVVNLMVRFVIYPIFLKQTAVWLTCLMYLSIVVTIAMVIYLLKFAPDRFRRRPSPEPLRMLLGGA